VGSEYPSLLPGADPFDVWQRTSMPVYWGQVDSVLIYNGMGSINDNQSASCTLKDISIHTSIATLQFRLLYD
jgi:hypothetical protein